jgi:hypothetical protein
VDLKRPGEPMVGWYDPQQLSRTGRDVAISTIFGQASDFRILEALAAPKDSFTCTVCEAGQPVWIDYTGDTGDGWNSTYTVAYWMTRPTLTVATPDGTATETTETGRVLIFGGDQVYPVASRDEYAARLVKPYESARPRSEPPYPELFAIPGNHDWYDNLVTFTRLFCNKDWLAGWRLRQKRSYFASRLPHGWWLIGTDIQLGSDIDEAQLDYFKDAAAKMEPDDRVILCTAEPYWITAELYRETNPQYFSEKILSYLETKVFHGRIQVFLAGDLHHYRRHEDDEGKQKITSGGGGAFLHPTHGPNVEELHQDLLAETAAGPEKQHSIFRKRAAYPDEKTSSRLTFRNLLFPLLNPTFGVITAILYLLFGWTTIPDLRGTTGVGNAIGTTFNAMLLEPLATLLFLAIILGFILFTDTHMRSYKWIAGTAHALLHIAAAFFISWGAAVWTERWFEWESSLQLLASGVLIMAGGWVAGSFILGLYLLISLNVFGRHGNEAFSSLKIEDYKNFLRMRIDPDGSLTIFPIGIERVAKRWKPGSEAGPKYEPDGEFTKPFLIEKPIRITPEHLRRQPFKGSPP